MASLHDELFKQELRNHCRCPRKFQLLDALGSALGTFFITQNVRNIRQDAKRMRKISGWNLNGPGVGWRHGLYPHAEIFLC